MTDYLTLSSVPYAEPCAQVGSDNYTRDSIIESRAYINQLQRMFPTDCGCSFRVKSFPHDFGSYREVVVIYNPEVQLQCNYAAMVDDSAPENWDAEALQELADNNYTLHLSN